MPGKVLSFYLSIVEQTYTFFNIFGTNSPKTRYKPGFMNDQNEVRPAPKRLYSLDALRGFDMFWIMGGEGIFVGLATLTGWPLFEWIAKQLDHVPWHGFVFYDMIFPLFLFIAGISFPFSLAKRTANNDSRQSIYWHVISRGLILVLLGIVYNNGVRFNLDGLRYGSVLGRIGLAWMFAALIFMNTRLTWRIIWFCVILLGYWILLMLFPARDLGSTDIYSMEGNLASYIDRMLMPGRLYLKIHDPEGLFSTIPAIGTALLGMFTGEFMHSNRWADKPMKKVLYLFIAAVILIVIGRIWNLEFPINKNIWTSSFVCYVGGLSLLFFAIFYLIIDVWNYKKWAFFFVVIGVNPITIYLVGRIINFRSATRFFFGGFNEILPEAWHPLIDGIGVTTIAWLFLYILWKKRIFLKI
jgi:predicted acyltransferase